MNSEVSQSTETPTIENHNIRRRKREKASPLQYAILFALVLIVFSPLLFSGELWNKKDSAQASGFQEISTWVEAWQPNQLRAYDPISRSSYFLEQALPLEPAFSHRLINLSLHLLAVFLLWSFLRKIRLHGTWLAVLVFALHPSIIPVLFWPGHRHVLLGFVLLLTILNLSADELSTKRYLLVIALSVIGIFIHPNFIFLPLLLALFTYSKRHPTQLNDYNWILPVFCICLFAGVWLSNKSGFETGPFVLSEWSFTAGHYMQYLLRQTFVPLELIFYQPIPANMTYSVTTGINLAPFLLFPPFVVLGVLNQRHQWARNLLFGVVCYFLFALSPIIEGGEFIDGTEAFELYSYYFALAVICISFVFMLIKFSSKLGFIAGLLLRILLIALLSLECIFSYTHSLETRDSSKMWQSISKQWPESGQAQMAYVESVLNQGSNKIKKDTLILLMQGLLEKEPEKVEIRKILARTLRDAGQPNNALREFRRILRDGTDDVVFLNEAADFLEYRGLEFEARKIRERAERLGEVLSQNTNPAS
jgi:hypothetical protein